MESIEKYKRNHWIVSGEVVSTTYNAVGNFLGIACIKLAIFRVPNPIRIIISSNIDSLKGLKKYIKDKRYAAFHKLEWGNIYLGRDQQLDNIPKVWYNSGSKEHLFKLSNRPFLPVNYISLRANVIQRVPNYCNGKSALNITDTRNIKDSIKSNHEVYIIEKTNNSDKEITSNLCVDIIGRVSNFEKLTGDIKGYRTTLVGDITYLDSN